uniref:aspartyl aminopeptidase n=1 Tax=Henneguya salminicola TaxID=69463 RepID=A0A6G3MJB0_HENSL
MAIANSFLLSADQAHALNPNFSEKHENLHKITLDHGVVIKYNSNQRYATSSFSSSIIQIIAKKCGIPVQKFSIRNDMSCGTTVGPILAALIGMIVVDIGFPMLSMHSIREMCASSSVSQAIKLYHEYYLELPKVFADSEQ